MFINSGYRCPAHNAKVSKTGESGPHTTGLAADIRISGKPAYELVAKAIELGATGIGLHQHGPRESRFVHLDTLANSADYPRPVIWTYA